MSRHGGDREWIGERAPASVTPTPPDPKPEPRRRKHRPKHRAPVLECEAHEPTQHRDGKPPWCPRCGLDMNGQAQTARGRLTLVVRACDVELARDDLDEATRALVEHIRDQATGGVE